MNPTHPTAPASMATHTPTPWHFNAKRFTICSIECGNEKPVAVLQTVNNAVARNETLSANAAFIVRACNSHAALVEALSAMYCAGFWTADELPNLPDHQRKAITAARAALTAAQS